MMMGASCDTPRVCLPQYGLARAKSYSRGLFANLPQNYPRAFRGLSGGQPVPLTGRATHPTATRFFLPSFFFY